MADTTAGTEKTMTTKITAAAAVLALSALALTGCVVENVPAGAQDPKPPATSTPSAAPTKSETPAEEDTSESIEDGGQDESKGETVDMGVEAGQVQYVRAIQNFSPTLERWLLDEEAGEVTYSIINCLGQPEAEGVATLEPAEGGEGTAYDATWIGKSPIESVAAKSVRLEITDDTLTNFSDVATSRTEIEVGNFSRMCVDAGETAADIVF
ncbi:hypothetical protein DXU92_01985 [Brachybacterium saurashtrense]|uniref:Uncharacterized protein n=2 Tax=Brachybacterium saurashtrense TaxID=556288 RepID=A0A345YPU4_9MICO|nr:hypothetical protein DWV08_10235 [Brachybacterium saurashtrense]RRR23684.1 hypothetical protein DXU92_01985 [Brachybacterium saurashtrense]